jgi:ribulose-phosphate 3-epimerase
MNGTVRAPANWFQALPRERLLGEFSLWSADLANLESEMNRVDGFVDLYHADVADGRFAPSFLFFPDQLARIRRLTQKPIHVHLMVEGDIVLSQVRQFAEAGADLISVHPENGAAATEEALSLIQSLGAKAGIVLRLETPVETIRPLVDRVSFVTLLGTAIGVKGQGLSETACPRLQEARAILRDKGKEKDVVLAADGGIRENTVPELRKASAETVVLGSLAFADPDLQARIDWLKGL